jgi:hypothetical protein
MSNIVKGVVMNNKYLLLYNEYMLNSIYRLNNKRMLANCCGDCDGSCVGGGVSSSDGRSGGSDGSGSKYRQVNIFNNALALPRPSSLTIPRPSALTLPRPSSLTIPRPSALTIPKSSVPSLTQSLFSKLCSGDNIHNDCICL